MRWLHPRRTSWIIRHIQRILYRTTAAMCGCVMCRLRAGRRRRGVRSRWRHARRSQTSKSTLTTWRPSSTLCRRAIDNPPLYSRAAQSGRPLSFRSTVGRILSSAAGYVPTFYRPKGSGSLALRPGEGTFFSTRKSIAVSGVELVIEAQRF